MPSKYVPWIVLQVSSSTGTSGGSLRPPKRPSKAKNGQKITVFGLDQPILVWRPPSSGPNSGIHRRTYNSKRYPPYFEPVGRNGGEPPEKKHKLAYIPTIQYIYTKKKFLTKTKCLKLISNHSMVVSGTFYNPFQGSFTHSGASGRLRSHILTKNWPFLTPPANPVQFFWLEMPSKYVPLIVLQVLTSTRTSRGSLRPPKRPSKAKNGQNHRFWSRPANFGLATLIFGSDMRSS